MTVYKSHVKLKDRGPAARRPTEELVAEILCRVFAEETGPVLVAIGGPGGTGKSTFARHLAEALPDAAVLGLDHYKTPRQARREAEIFGPHPEANKMGLIARHLRAIRHGESIERPVYDGAVGEAQHTETYAPAHFNLIDGEVATYGDFHDLVDFSIFIDSDWRTQLETRLGRDLDERDYSLDKAVATFLHSNLREFTEHGAESKNWADLHLFCSSDYRLRVESVSRELYEQVESILHREMEDLELRGLIVPLLTPFDGEEGIERRAFAEHLDWLAQAGVRRVLVGGTTGEFFSLTAGERLDLLKLALEYFPGLILFQAGSTALATTLELAEGAEHLGADGIVCLPPFYFADAPDEGLLRYMRAVSERVSVPLMLYNFPRHTGVRFTRELLAQIEHFGMKDSSADLSLIASTPRYFIGGDPKIVASAREGAVGFVSGVANAAPGIYVELEHALAEEDWGKAEELQGRVKDLVEPLEPRHAIATIKRRLAGKLEGYPVRVRAPLAKSE